VIKLVFLILLLLISLLNLTLFIQITIQLLLLSFDIIAVLCLPLIIEILIVPCNRCPFIFFLHELKLYIRLVLQLSLFCFFLLLFLNHLQFLLCLGLLRLILELIKISCPRHSRDPRTVWKLICILFPAFFQCILPTGNTVFKLLELNTCEVIIRVYKFWNLLLDPLRFLVFVLLFVLVG